jgi:inorganic pyrophosphatase
MEDKKYVQKLLEVLPHSSIDKIRIVDLKQDHEEFEGSPKRHPNNENIIILVQNPFDEKKVFYEFYMDTISSIEEIGTISSDDGKNAYIIRLWVKKSSLAIKSETFIV